MSVSYLRKPRPYLTTACFVLLSSLMLSPGTLSPLGTYDEGIPLVVAQRILAGEIPHKDFWMMYPPGQGYLVVLFSYLSGGVVGGLRAVDLLSRVLLCFIVLSIIRDYLSSTVRFQIQAFVWIITILLLSRFNIQGYNVLQALALALLSFQFFGRSIIFSLLSGFMLGLLAIVRLDFFVYAILSYALLIFMEWISKRAISCMLSPHVSMLMMGAIAVLIVPVVRLYLDPHLFEAFIQQCFITPLEIFPEVRSISYPTLSDILSAESVSDKLGVSLFYLGPGLFFVIMLGSIVVYYRVKPNLIDGKLLLLPLFGVQLFNQVRVRSDSIHLEPFLFILTISLLIITSILIGKLPTQRMKLYRSVLSLGFLVLFALTLYRDVTPSIRKMALCSEQRLSFERCLLQEQDSRLESMKYVKRNLKPHERLLIVSDDNDHVEINDVAFYAIASRLPLTRFHELHPGIVTTNDAQLEIIRRIKDSNTSIILQQSGTAKKVPVEDVSVGLLDQYLQQHFEEVFASGNYHFLRAR